MWSVGREVVGEGSVVLEGVGERSGVVEGVGGWCVGLAENGRRSVGRERV